MCTSIEVQYRIPSLIVVIYNVLILGDNFSKDCDIEFLICIKLNITWIG